MKIKAQSLVAKLLTNLTFWVLIAILFGIFLGHYFPGQAMQMEIVGKTFVDLIKLFIAPIIFLTIVLGISSMGDLRKVGRIGTKSLLYFEIVTTFALVIGIAVAYLIQPGKVDKSGLSIQDPAKFTANPKAFSWMDFFLANTTLQVLTAAIIVGVRISYFVLGQAVKNCFYGIEIRDVSGTNRSIRRNGVHDRKIRARNPHSARQTYAHRIHYHGAVHFCGFG